MDKGKGCQSRIAWLTVTPVDPHGPMDLQKLTLEVSGLKVHLPQQQCGISAGAGYKRWPVNGGGMEKNAIYNGCFGHIVAELKY